MSACRAFAYALRPRLSTRLTLGGQALPRKPWAYGGRVSHPALATHASILTPPAVHGRSPLPLRPPGEAPLPLNRSVRRFGAQLSPVYCRRMSTRPVSCYALFERMAASKPTSWLSGRTHILCHSAATWGPWRAVWAVPLSSAELSPPRSDSRDLDPAAFGVRSGSAGSDAPSPVRCSTSAGELPRLALKPFRGERDISGLDWPFTPTPGSSPPFSTDVRSALHRVLPLPQPALG